MNQKIPTIPDVGFMRLTDILKVFPIGRSTWWAKVKEGEYPKPVKLGPNTSAWRAQDIKDLIKRVEGLQEMITID